jgi:hypothetical protein
MALTFTASEQCYIPPKCGRAVLVPRLCRGTHCASGSAARPILTPDPPPLIPFPRISPGRASLDDRMLTCASSLAPFPCSTWPKSRPFDSPHSPHHSPQVLCQTHSFVRLSKPPSLPPPSAGTPIANPRRRSARPFCAKPPLGVRPKGRTEHRDSIERRQ